MSRALRLGDDGGLEDVFANFEFGASEVDKHSMLGAAGPEIA